MTRIISFINTHTNFKKILINAGWLFFDKIIRLGIGVIVGVWIARYLGPEQFGILNYAIAFIALFSAITTLGLDSILIKSLVNSFQNQNLLLGSVFITRVFVSLLIIIIANSLMFLLEADTSLIFWITFINSFTLLFQSFDVIDHYFQAKVKSKYVVIARNSAFLLSTALKVYFVWFKYPLLAFAWATLIELLLGAIFLIMAYQFDKEKIILWRYKKSVALSLIKESWPLLLSALMIIIYMRVDQIMIGRLLGAKEVGIYSAAVKLTEVWYFIPTSIAASVFPTILKLKSLDPNLYKIRIQQMYVAMTWLALAISIPMTFVSDTVVELIYGMEFTDAGPVLAISIWSGIFVFQGVARGYWLIAEGLQNYSMYYIGGACLVNVVLNFGLIPLWGIKGAAIATAFSYFTSVIVFPFILKETRISSIQLIKSFLWIMK